MASEKVSRKMVLEIKYVNANNAVIHTENSKLLLDLNCKLVTGILAKISLGTGIWAKFRLGTGIWYPPSRPSNKNHLSVKEAVSRGPEPFLLRYTPFCAYMSKYIFLVRITKCVIAKSDYMPVFTIERTEPHLKPGI